MEGGIQILKFVFNGTFLGLSFGKFFGKKWQDIVCEYDPIEWAGFDLTKNINERVSMKRIVVFAIFLFFYGTSVAAPELKGSPQELRGFLHPTDKVVSISGEAEETAYSDKAVVSLVVTTTDDLLSKAMGNNSTLRRKIKDALVSKGISTESIKSSKFSSSPQYGWFGREPSSFEVVNRIAISILDEKHLEEIAVVADQYKEVELSETSFEHTKKEEFNEKVKAKALEKILKQKEFYEESLGLKLIPTGIRDSNIYQVPTRGAEALEEVLVVSARRREKENFSSLAKTRGDSRSSSFDEVKYRANISVDFKIIDG